MMMESTPQKAMTGLCIVQRMEMVVTLEVDTIFCVDAGAIGIMPLELIADKEKLESARKLGLVIEGELFANFTTTSCGYFEVEVYDMYNKSVEKFDINTRL